MTLLCPLPRKMICRVAGASQRLDVSVPGPFGNGVVDVAAQVDSDADGVGTANECHEDNNGAEELGIECFEIN